MNDASSTVPVSSPTLSTPSSVQSAPTFSEPELFDQLASSARVALAGKSGAPTSKPVAKSTNQTTRTKIMQAIAASNLAALQVFADAAVDFNFYASRGGSMISPLNYACQCGWEKGAYLLMDAGAREHLTRANWEALSPQEKARQPLHSAISIVDHFCFSGIFRRLFENEPHLRKALAKKAASYDWGAEVIVDMQAVSALKGTSELDKVEIALFDKDLPEARRAMLLDQFWTQAPECLSDGQAKRWGNVLRRDSLEALEVLAQRTRGSNQRASLTMTDVYRLGFAQSRSVLRPFAKHSKVSSYQVSSVKEQYEIPLWLAAVVFGATRCLKVFGSVPAFSKTALEFAQKSEWLVFVSSAPSLREAQRQGLLLSDCVNSAGETPLHLACLMGTKTRITDLAGVCAQWLSEKDHAGHTPLSHLSHNERSGTLGATLEKMVMGAAMGVSASGKSKGKSKKTATLKAVPSEALDPSTTPKVARTRRL